MNFEKQKKEQRKDLLCTECSNLNSKVKELSHALRSPLSVLSINLEDLKERGSISQEAVEDTTESLKEIVRLVDELG